jgi:hypothetical protein
MKANRFKINAVEVSAPFRLRITFGDGVVMDVDLDGVINRYPALSPLKEEALFSRAHVGEWGLTVDWISGEIDLAGDNLRAEAIEQSGGISHERIWNWMHRNKLTLDGAAAALGISRRMVAYYRNGERPIPKHIWLACLGWERCAAEGPEAWKEAA